MRSSTSGQQARLTRAEPLRVLAEFLEPAAMSKQIVGNFIGGVVEGIAVGGTTNKELVHTRMMAARLEQACDLALEGRGVASS